MTGITDKTMPCLGLGLLGRDALEGEEVGGRHVEQLWTMGSVPYPYPDPSQRGNILME